MQIESLNIPLERDGFLGSLVQHLADTLEQVVGLKEAEGFLSVVGQKTGEEINSLYKNALNLPHLSKEQVTQVLIDLKRRIKGKFYIIEESDEKIVFGNSACPFAEKVVGHPSMCMMTSNVFGHIVAENLGYAKLSLEKTIANGHTGCRIVVYIKKTPESENAKGREYFRGSHIEM